MYNMQNNIVRSNINYYLKTFKKVKKVIQTCETSEQLFTAMEYFELFEKRYVNNSFKKHYKHITEIHICLRDKCKELGVAVMYTIHSSDERTKDLGVYTKEGEVISRIPEDLSSESFGYPRCTETGRINSRKINKSNVPKRK